jgi:hypothetical protein
MNLLIQLKQTTTSIFLVSFAFAYFGRSPAVQAVSPAPDGCYPNFTTAEGCDALNFLTTGAGNTGLGWRSLFLNSIGSFNTGVGAGALALNTADNNTATGTAALLLNTTGVDNTANGAGALVFNSTGNSNTANGFQALESNTTGSANTATGAAALGNNTTGSFNTAHGALTLINNTTGAANTVIGNAALAHNTTGNNNIAVGAVAGQNLTTGDYNIDIGNIGVAGEANNIRIGDDSHQGATFIAGVYGMAVSGLTVVMDSSDHLGTASSSRRFKEEIKPMAQTSQMILALKPVTFRYKKEIDPARTAQFGLVAEEVEKVNPDLVVRDKEGKPYTVRYDAVNAMLLNEFLKEHRKVQLLEKAMAEQQKENAATRAMLKEQAAQIQKVSAQLEVHNPAPQTVLNNR